MEEESLFVSEEYVADPVVSEMPVVLDNAAGDRVVLLQYPTRRHTQEFRVAQVRVKPGAQAVETDLEAPVPAQYIDSAAGSTLQGLSQTYAGVLKASGGRFAAGYVHGGALHLTLVPRTAQLRPKFAGSRATTLLQPSMLQAAAPRSAAGGDAGAPALRSVQMSVKSTNAEAPKHSSVLEFWRQANKEEAVVLEPRAVTAEERSALLAAEPGDSVVDLALDASAALTFV